VEEVSTWADQVKTDPEWAWSEVRRWFCRVFEDFPLCSLSMKFVLQESI
jgi:hypothetical protein